MTTTPQAASQLGSYADVQAYLIKIFTADKAPGGSNAEDDAANGAPHGAFWATLSYQQFVAGNVPGVTDPKTGQAMPILSKGNSAQSNIITALRGTPGSPFDPNTGAFGQMPADGAAFLTEAQIAPLAAWIDAGCPA
jgi:hypothetical protein